MGIVWSKSGEIARDNNDNRAIAAEAEFFEGGTATPLTVYEDSDEATPHDDPVVADGNGRWPLVFIPFCVSYDVKVTTAGGTQLYYYREIPNADPVEASEDSVDDAELIQTGQIIFDPKTGTKTGFVRCNARTIGSASSGATERANADTEDLYTYNWNNFADGILAVTTGRGASAAADFAANKPMALFDGRGGVLRGVDDMGNSAASALTLATFTTGDATTGGSIAGVNSHTITEAQLPNHTHSFSATTSSETHTHTTGNESANHDHNITTRTGTVEVQAGTGAADIWQGTNAGTTGTQNANHTHTISASGAHTHTVSGTSGTGSGSGSAHNNVSKSILGNLLQKL